MSFLVVLGCVLCGLILSATGWMVWQQRQTAITDAGVNIQNVSRAVADEVSHALGLLTLAQNKLLSRLAVPDHASLAEIDGAMASGELHAAMLDLSATSPEAYSFVLINADGLLLQSSRLWPTPALKVLDRPYFAFARDHPGIGDFVSEPLLSKATGQSSFALVHVFRGPDGQFGGLLLSVVQVQYLEHLFSLNILPKGATNTLAQDSGVILVHYPPLVEAGATRQSPQIKDLLPFADRGPFRHAPLFAQAERLFAVARVAEWPLFVIVSEPFSSALASWSVQAIGASLVAAMGCLATMVVMVLGLLRIRSQRLIQIGELALVSAEQHKTFAVALDNLSQALLVFDANDRLKLSNMAVADMYGVTPGALMAGMTMMEVIQCLRSKDNATDADAVLRFYRDLVKNNVRTSFVRKRSDKRVLAGTFVPMPDGWLLTFEDTTEVHQANERVEHMALHDALTGLPNRVLMWARTEDALAGLAADGRLAVMYLDLDDFKAVNDTLGHPAGDKLLQRVCQRIQAETRAADVIARLGGDEFAILVTAPPDLAFIQDMADRLVELLGEPYEIDGQLVDIGVSIGIAVAPEHGLDPDALMKNADLALYQAKRNGRGRHQVFETAMWQQAFDRRRLELELKHAVLHDEFELFYQPIVSARTRRICGFESLLRWHHPVRGVIPPSDFIPIAEDNGSIVQIGEWALNAACRQAADWPQNLKVAVNLSPVQFRAGALVHAVENALAISGLAPERLELEITESSMMKDTEATVETLMALKAIGVRIAMDDFGTGYSSLAYLQRFPFDKVKIDRAFIADIDVASSLAIVRAVTGIANSLGITTTAEGVETEEQFACVAREGCDEIQGFLFGVPFPGPIVSELLSIQRRRAPETEIAPVPGVYALSPV